MISRAGTQATVVTLKPSGKLERLREALRDRAPQAGRSLVLERDVLEQAVCQMPIADGVRCRPVDAAGVPAEWVEPIGQAVGSRTVLYFHGGGYVLGSLNTVRPLAANMAVAASAGILTVDYRLAPEHPHPAAVADGVTVYCSLLDSGVDPALVFLGGDSAGGGLAIAVMLALRESGLPLPAGAVCLSPWADLTLSAPSLQRNALGDPQVPLWLLAEMAKLYLAGQDPRSPLASPAFADLAGFPPLLIQAGTAEALVDDSVALSIAARRAGVQVTLELYEDMIHVWHNFAPGLPEGTEAIARIAAWMRERG